MVLAADDYRMQTLTTRYQTQDIKLPAPAEGTLPLPRQIELYIAAIDVALGALVNAVLHDPVFQRTEASWRGLYQLVMNTETGEMLKLRVLNVRESELRDDLKQAIDKDQSQLFKKLYEEEYGTFGGSAFGVLLYDKEFGRSPGDVEFLTSLSGVAAAAHAPLVAAASPGLFDLPQADASRPDFTRLGAPRDLAKIFEAIDMAGWRSFRASEDSRYVTLVLPRVLARLPYGAATNPVEGMNFEEDVEVLGSTELFYDFRATGDGEAAARPKAHAKYLWATAVWALGERITEAFALYGWCAAIRGVEGGGIVPGLPLHTFKTPDGETVAKIPTEVSITDRREKELNDLGFIALCYCKGSDYACFFGGATTQKPVVYTNPEASQNAQASALLPYVLAASRFAHYIKKIGRDKVGSFQTRGTLEKYLNNWIADYVLLNDDAPQSAKARYPLREARIDVTEVPGKVGAYNATVFLRPHFQLEELTASIRLVAHIPPPAAA
ncbi:MAG TPA: type VI secretion system contractile sheath large subunit [Longimicrobium sp.]|nr:type VI secretion system contractile sheath large subunit [Longimicrobium sp.]